MARSVHCVLASMDFAPDCGHVLLSKKDEENVFLLAEESCMAQSYPNNKTEGLSGRGKRTAFHRR